MKVYVQVIDRRTGVYQTGMIDEPIEIGQEIVNALAHFGVSYGSVTWDFKHNIQDDENNHDEYNVMTGRIDGTTKVVSVIY